MSKPLVAILVVLGEWTANAAPHPPHVRALLLPTRRADAAELRDRVTRIARLLAPQAGGVAIDDDGSDEAGNILLRAQRLAAAGALDDAAAVFDAALEATSRAPHHAADPAALVAAHVTRASIALARGEPGRADQLLE